MPLEPAALCSAIPRAYEHRLQCLTPLDASILRMLSWQREQRTRSIEFVCEELAEDEEDKELLIDVLPLLTAFLS